MITKPKQIVLLGLCVECDAAPIENQDTGLCASCGRELRKSLKVKVKVVHPVKKVTEKRAKQNREYLKMREDFLIQYPVCQVKDCQKKSAHVHHRRGRQNDLLTNPEWFLAICEDHHIYYTEHSKEAIEKGISVSRLEKT